MSDEFATPTQASGHRSTTLLDELIALRPIDSSESTMETSQGTSTVRWVEALIIDPESGSYRNLGELPIFWTVVRRQLNDARPWIAGRIVQQGRAYRMAPPNRDEGNAINKALRQHRDNPAPVESLDPDAGADYPDEAPF